MFAISIGSRQAREVIFSVILSHMFAVKSAETQACSLQVIMLFPRNLASINVSFIQEESGRLLSSAIKTNYNVSWEAFGYQSLKQMISFNVRRTFFNNSNTVILSFLKNPELKIVHEILRHNGMQHWTFSKDFCFLVN